jgi:predicted RNA-binding Zn-ribbon protein involved in translation (DUF1610 family)
MNRSRFFCENCGTEVKAHARVCPKCGRFFSAVRCPNCGYTGEGREFLHGCPSCGYSGGVRGSRRAQSEEWYDAEELESGAAPGASTPRRGGRRFVRERQATPAWVYWLALGLLSLAFLIMVIIYVRLT